MTPWYARTAAQALEEVRGTEGGLAEVEAVKRLKEFGPNALPEKKPPSYLVIFIEQFKSPLIYILFVAATIVLFMGELVDGAIIFFVLLLNAVIGVVQEGRAQNTLRALTKFVKTNATVIRDGEERIIPDREVVPGDILIVREGERIAADVRLIRVQSLRVNESSLTGEATTVSKTSEVLSGDNLPSGEQRNLIFRGTHAVAGTARGVVVATGGGTIIGGIAREISGLDTEIPLKTEIRHLANVIIMVVAAVTGTIFAIGTALGHSVREMFAVVVSLSVSIIPEGLPIVVTIVLATGAWRMFKRNALIKKLQAVESLGQARVIAVDKTGTITRNELVVRAAWTTDGRFAVTGDGYEPKGEAILSGEHSARGKGDDLMLLARTAMFASSARLSYVETAKEWRISGDPTEAAMIVFAEKLGVQQDELARAMPLLEEIPFDYRLKYHAVTHQTPQGPFLAVAGAPEAILERCTKIRRGGSYHELTKDDARELEETFLKMSAEGLRVIALAVRDEAPKELLPDAVKGLSFLGFLGMEDTLRSEVAEAMRRAKDAGIRVVMITGDHAVTARAIAEKAGIFNKGDKILTDAEIDKMFDPELAEALHGATVFARITPEHKARIVSAYKRRGEIVAMTGDGVNDAPSLVAADLGVAMGKIGTDVAKEAADIILLDDDFGTIISAVEEGRSIYQTIKKVILYLFSTSAGETITIAVALLVGLPLPLLAAQIIWLNFVTDGFLDVSLAMEPKEKGLLNGAFGRSKRRLVDTLMARRMVFMAVPMAAGSLALFTYYLTAAPEKALTVSLTVLAMFQWFNAWNCRSERDSLFSMNPFSNKALVAATVVVASLQVLAVYTPFLQSILSTVPLAPLDWLFAAVVAVSIVVVEEVRKLAVRERFAPAVFG